MIFCRKKKRCLFLLVSLSFFTVVHWYYKSNQTRESSRRNDSDTTTTDSWEAIQSTQETLRNNTLNNVNHFTDLLADLRAFGPDKTFTLPAESEDELSGHNENPIGNTGITSVDQKNVPPNNEYTLPEETNPGSDSMTSWLFNNPNVAVYPTITEDVMPDYFEFSADLVPQYEHYHKQTRVIMNQRLETLNSGCERIRKYVKHEQDFVFYFPELRMGWCPVFKAGSTNWKQFFCKIYLPDVYEEWLRKTDQDPYCPLGELLDFSIRKREMAFAEKKKRGEIVDENEISNLKEGLHRAATFLTVRHPYERLVSMYTNKFQDCISHMFSNADGIMVKILQKYRNVDEKLSPEKRDKLMEAARLECRKPVQKRRIDKNNPYMNPMGATFKEATSYIIHNFKHGVWPDFHWIQVTKQCDVCLKDYQVIEKFETMERDHYFLLKTLGEEARYSEIAGAHGNPSVRGSNPHDLVIQYLSQLDEQVLWDLYAIYKDDFLVFGYTPHFRVKKNPNPKH